MNNIKTLEQGRASKAFEFATAGKDIKEYKQHAKKVPMLIKTNGLGNTIAFMKSKKSDAAWQLLFEQTQKWLISNELYNEFKWKDNQVEKTLKLDGAKITLENYLTQIDSALYRSITNEVMALFSWIRRFAEGLSNDKEA